MLITASSPFAGFLHVPPRKNNVTGIHLQCLILKQMIIHPHHLPFQQSSFSLDSKKLFVHFPLMQLLYCGYFWWLFCKSCHLNGSLFVCVQTHIQRLPCLKWTVEMYIKLPQMNNCLNHYCCLMDVLQPLVKSEKSQNTNFVSGTALRWETKIDQDCIKRKLVFIALLNNPAT